LSTGVFLLSEGVAIDLSNLLDFWFGNDGLFLLDRYDYGFRNNFWGLGLRLYLFRLRSLNYWLWFLFLYWYSSGWTECWLLKCACIFLWLFGFLGCGGSQRARWRRFDRFFLLWFNFLRSLQRRSLNLCLE